jgi:3-hydroxymyristoyl/3-hydroxydecanoyl-(acyl carrier protein) dehydratase
MAPVENTEIPFAFQPPADPPANPGALLYRANQILIDALVATGQRAAHAQTAFLETSRSALQEMTAAVMHNLSRAVPRLPALFSRRDLEEFATGSIARCFGPEYQVFEGQRYPRIPNGDLLLMDRVVSITGKRHELKKGAAIVTEYDVSPDAWFYLPGSPALPPYSVLMEMALQPCGQLSAYLGSSFLLKGVDLYFRNLDGHAEVLASPDLRGKTVTARAELLSSTLSGTTIIQGYHFSLACEGEPFYSGESVFGYFSAAGMANQVGLDGPQSPIKPPSFAVALPADAQPVRFDRPVAGPLGLLDEIVLLPSGGPHQIGQIQARQIIDPRDWFYRCHFHQDPVMPGSLGVEAALQAITLFAQRLSPGKPDASTANRYSPTGHSAFVWKYRGQILPTQKEMTLCIDILSREAAPGGETISGNASIWVDGNRIYELKNLSITLQPSN